MVPEKSESDTFESYYSKWPDELRHFPECVIRQWIFEHNDCFLDKWAHYDLKNWRFSKVVFQREQLAEIDHFSDERKFYLELGKKWLQNNGVLNGWIEVEVTLYMLKNGTFPAPIIVGVNGGHLRHPKSRGEEYMRTPYQILEGHSRWATAIASLEMNLTILNDEHDVWLVDLKENKPVDNRT